MNNVIEMKPKKDNHLQDLITAVTTQKKLLSLPSKKCKRVSRMMLSI